MIEIERIDDYQSWCIHCDHQRLIIDPWLVDDVQVGREGRWLKRTHRQPVALRPRDLQDPDIVVLTSALPTHAHKPTLMALDRNLRVIGPPRAVAMARRMGFRSTIALGSGSRVVLDERFALTGIRPRFPFGLISIGFLFESLDDGIRVYMEPYLPPDRHPALDRGADVLITPVEQVRMAGIALSQDLDQCVALARRVRARWVLATGNDPGASTGLVPERLWRIEPAGEAFESVIRLHVGEDRGRVLAPGERVPIPPRRRRRA